MQVNIGLEIHVRLATRTKMFCRCEIDDLAKPNTRICPICAGHPGTLPVVNGQAVKAAIKLANSLSANINLTSTWVRKSYFYPDLPKGYQITQGVPFAEKGRIHALLEDDVGIIQIHLEEDSGSLSHSEQGSFVDLNRAGVPLAEIVTEPTIRSADQAEALLRSLHATLLASGASYAKIERGHLRCDVNISLGNGEKVEIKNLTSFKRVKSAINSEILRQQDLLASGVEISSNTRSWTSSGSFMTRQKVAADYRITPEHDLKDLVIPNEWADSDCLDLNLRLIEKEKVELWDLRQLGLSSGQIQALGSKRSHFLTLVGEGYDQAKVLKVLNQSRDLAKLRVLLSFELKQKEKSSSMDGLEDLVHDIILSHPKEVIRYKAGQKRVLGYFVGLVLKAVGGKVEPLEVKTLLDRVLEQTESR